MTRAMFTCSEIKIQSQGKPVVVVPLLLICDDTSGNRSKQWNMFISWLLLLGGLPKHMNTQLQNIHFICTSNQVSALEMACPIVEGLLKLEKGVFMYDAYFHQEVLVIAPLLALLADNPMASVLVSHLTGNPHRFCRICKVI